MDPRWKAEPPAASLQGLLKRASEWWKTHRFPALGDGVGYSPNQWIGHALFQEALKGGPPVRNASWNGNLVTPPQNLFEGICEISGMRLVRIVDRGNGNGDFTFACETSMLQFSIYSSGKEGEVSLSTSNEEVIDKINKLLSRALQPDNPREGIVFTLAKGMTGYNITRLGIAGTPLVRSNYSPKVLADYDHVVQEQLSDSPCGRLTILSGSPGTGKCVAAGTLVMDVATGVLRPVEETVRDRLRVVTFDRDMGMVPCTPSAWIHTGRKVCLRVITKAGHVLDATPEHPLLTPDDWMPLESIQPGMYVAAAARVPFPEHVVDLPDDHVVLLAGLLAEGNYTTNHVTFTNADPVILATMHEALRCVEGEFYQCPSNKRPYDWRIKSPVVGRTSKIRMLLNEYGLGHKKAPEKVIPDAVFKLGPRQLATFLGLLWSCDGSIERHKTVGDITLGMASKVLIEQVQHLLLRFGIRSTVKPKMCRRKGMTFYSWRLRVIGTSRRLFVESIPMVGEKSQKARLLTFHENPNDDLIPLTASVRLAIEVATERHRAAGGSFKGMSEALGWGTDGGQASEKTLLRRDCCSRRMLEAFIKTTGAVEMEWLTRVRWEQVVSVESIGDRDVFDLTVPTTHNFLANDIVAHNTYLVRSLLADAPRVAYILIPPHLVESLGSPEILPALTQAKQEFNGPIMLIIEDADRCLVKRDDGNMDAISSMLNLGDGILGSILDVRILATTNADMLQMDAATRRKGRLCRHIEVGMLTPAQATAALSSLVQKPVQPFTEDTSLADVYAKARTLGWAPPPKTKPSEGKYARPELV